MHRDVEAADRALMRLSDLLRLTLENIGQQEIPLPGGARLPRQVCPDRADALRRSTRRPFRRPAGHARHDGAEPDPAAARGERDQAWRSGPGHIDISARREGDKLRMEVRDDGVGLSEDALTALRKASACRRRGRACSTSSAPITGSSSTVSRRDCRSLSRFRGRSRSGRGWSEPAGRWTPSFSIHVALALSTQPCMR